MSHSKPQVLHNQAVSALRRIHACLRGAGSREALEGLLTVLFERQRRLVLYLGSGCSKNVRASGWRPLNWDELLTEMTRALAPRAKKDLQQELRKRRCDPLNRLERAWFIGAAHGERRDEVLRELLEPRAHERASPFFEQVLALPFKDIVTTNYDSNLAYFLHKCRPADSPDQLSFCEIFDDASLGESLHLQGKPRVVFLHGRFGPNGIQGPRLVLDRFDYPKLYRDKNDLIAFVTALLRDSHALYIGFGLSDPSFDYMQAELEDRYGSNRLQSFAFVSHREVTTHEREHWKNRDRKLGLIELKNMEALPKILQWINAIVSYVAEAEPDRPAGKRIDDDHSSHYVREGLDAYAEGRFDEAWLSSRAALASTLFWSRRPALQDRELSKAWTVCQIRLRLALSHYKLRSVPGSGRMHDGLMVENMRTVTRILKAAKPRVDADNLRTEWAPLEMSLNILRARSSYYDSRYQTAADFYQQVVERRALYRRWVHDWNVNDSASVMSGLRASIAYYYARCQISRINYQLGNVSRPKEKARMLRVEKETIELLASTKRYVYRLRRFDFTPPSDENVGELDYVVKSLRTIRLIARWMAGRQTLGEFKEVLPERRMRTKRGRDSLSAAISLLDVDKPLIRGAVADLKRAAGKRRDRTSTLVREALELLGDQLTYSLTSSPDFQRALDTLAGIRTEDPVRQRLIHEAASRLGDQRATSSRWNAQRLRYLARAHGLRWTVCETSPHLEADTNDLRLSFAALRQAEELSASRGLEEQQTVNYLETARLNVLVLFSERVRGSSLSPLTLSAAVHHLSMFFDRIASVPDRIGNVTWMQTLGYRATAYLSLVAGREELAGCCSAAPSTLARFLRMPRHQQVDQTLSWYGRCAQKNPQAGQFRTRREAFRDTFTEIEKELAAIEARLARTSSR